MAELSQTLALALALALTPTLVLTLTLTRALTLTLTLILTRTLTAWQCFPKLGSVGERIDALLNTVVLPMLEKAPYLLWPFTMALSFIALLT